MNASNSSRVQPAVINWHVTDACNYRCRYCYAKWQDAGKPKLIRNPAGTRALLGALYSHFSPQGTEAKPRVNFAGGEPLLDSKPLLAGVQIARSLGFDVSLISNGSCLSEPLIADLAPELSVLGLSIDAVQSEALAEIGRHDRRGRQIDFARLASCVALARRKNPTLLLKINTVVCAANWQEDLSDLIGVLSPQRWKVLRMLPVVSRELEVLSEQFWAFVDRHRLLADLMTVEDNDDMVESYIMVDPWGRFFQNRAGAFGYDYSPCILDVGADEAFSRIGWSPIKFEARSAGSSARVRP